MPMPIGEGARNGDPARLRPVLLCSAIALLLACTGISLRGCGAPPAVLLCDVSWSTGHAAMDVGSIGSRAGLDPGTTAVFAFGESVVSPAGGAGGWPRIDGETIRQAGEGASLLRDALDRAISELHAGGRIVVATDGRISPEMLAAQVNRLMDKAITLDVETIGRRVPGDYRVESLRVPARIEPGAACPVDVAVRGPADVGCRVLLAVDGQEVTSRSIRTGAAGGVRLRFSLPPLAVGFREVTVMLRGHAGDPQPRNDRRSAGVVVGGVRSAVVVNAPELVAALAAEGYRARVGSPQEAGGGSEDLCIMRNVSVLDLGDGGVRLRSFVEAGGGLIVIGGPASYGPGGYAGRPLSDCLPVRSAPEGEGLEVTVLLDRSGTMGEGFSEEEGTVKLRAAREAVRRLLATLPDGTGFTLVPFAEQVDGRPERIVLTRGSRTTALAAVDRVALATGSTALIPPLAAARALAPGLPDRKWLVLLVTDGQLVGESGNDVVAAARELSRAGASVQALAVGRNANVGLLSRLVGPEGEVRSVTMGGEFEESILDALLALEGEGRVLEGSFEVRRPGEKAYSHPGVIHGLVRTWRRDAAEVLLETKQGYPVLARCRFGLGRSVAITTDPSGRWAPDWPLAALVGALAAEASRPAELHAVRASVTRGERMTELELTSAGVVSGVEGVIDLPDGSRQKLSFRPRGADRMVASLDPRTPAGAAKLSVEMNGGLSVIGISIPYPPEYGDTGPDPDGSARLRALMPGAGPPPGITPLMPWLAAAGLLLLLADRVLLAVGGRRGFKRRVSARR